MKECFYFPISINWLQRAKWSRACYCALSHRDGAGRRGVLPAPLLTLLEDSSALSWEGGASCSGSCCLSSKRMARWRGRDWSWGGRSPWEVLAKQMWARCKYYLHVPWAVRASGARPSSLGSAQAVMCAVAALSAETSLLPIPAAVSIGTVLICAHGVGCTLCFGTTFHLYRRAWYWAWFCLGLSGPSFYSQLATWDRFQLHFCLF